MFGLTIVPSMDKMIGVNGRGREGEGGRGEGETLWRFCEKKEGV